MSDINIINQLIVATAMADRQAFARLYDHTSSKLFAVCLRILNNRADAEDALQEIYVKIWKKSSTFALSEHSPMSWLVVIARNHCIDVVRARKPISGDIEDTYDVADDSPSPESAAINRSDGRRIDQCLAELEKKHADAVTAAYMDGYSYQELAEKYAVPVNTMRTWLRRSLAKLKDCLEQ
ncbi:MAG: sigma-70 family RNA polymerase sigma factor [Ahrensia sp.]|nr:sigma-70 family RNA polymerase sigma factor [Ahrensia sp.]